MHALNDYRLCKTVEKYSSKDAVLKILKKFGMAGFCEYSHDESVYFKLRDELLSLIS